MVTLRQLRYLEALAETLHFGQAAEACAVTQPALSMQIKELEEELQVSLIERRKSGIELTEQGEEIVRRGRTILASVRDLLDYAKHRERVLSGALKLGAIPSIAPYLLPAALPELQRRFPDLTLQLRETITETLIRELVGGDLDLILVALPIEGHEIETLPLFDDKFVLAARATKGKRAKAAEMLAHERLLLLEEGHCLRDQALSFCRLVTPEARESFECVEPRHHRADGRPRLWHHTPAGNGRGERGASAERHSPAAFPCARAKTRGRARLAKDLATQGGLSGLCEVAQGGDAAPRQILIEA
jgi:LysR family hydrogen peroxide-inducible transcriptional activator